MQQGCYRANKHSLQVISDLHLLKRWLASALSSAVLFTSNASALRLYTPEKYEAARARAVEQARQGELDAALKSLQRLLKLEPGNPGALNDYITVLVWDKQYRTALQQFPQLDLKKVPEYVLRALVNAANFEKNQDISDRVVAEYMRRYDMIPGDTPEFVSGNSYQQMAQKTSQSGMYTASLSILKKLHEREPENQTLLADLIVTLSKTGNHRQALAMSKSLKLSGANDYVLAALLVSADRLNDAAQEEKLTALYQQRFDKQPQIKLAESPATPESSVSDVKPLKKAAAKLSKVDRDVVRAREWIRQGNLQEAQDLLLPLYLQGHDSLDFLKTAAEFFSLQDKHVQSAHLYQKIIKIQPDNLQAQQAFTQQLSYAGAYRLVTDRLSAEDGAAGFSKQESALNTFMQDLSWSQMTLPEKQHFRKTIDDLVKHYEAMKIDRSNNDEALKLRIQADYMAALAVQGDSKGILAEYELMQGEAKKLPDYALILVADACLSERQPEQAKAIYQDLLTRSPDNMALKRSLFYSCSDMHDYGCAMKIATDLSADTPLWRIDHSGEIIKNNSEKLSADMLLANAYAYQGDLQQAQARLEKLRSAAPYNAEIIENLSNIYRWRGWPQKAHDLAGIGETISPKNHYVTLVKTTAELELKDYAGVDENIKRLNRQMDSPSALRDINEDWSLYNKRHFYSRMELGNSSGDTLSSNYGESDRLIESYLYDKPHNYYYRPFLYQHFSSADFIEGTGYYRRLGVGLDYNRQENQVSIAVTGSYSGQSDIGFELQGKHVFNDYLQMSLGYESFSTDIPLRAYFHDITGNNYTVSGEFRLNELTRISANAGFLDFSDGNERLSVNVAFSHRVVNRPDYQLTLIPSVYASSNKQSGGPYFSPLNDVSYNFVLLNEWQTYRRYDFHFTQKFELGAGLYDQKNHDSELTSAFVYQHDWSFDKQLSFNYGLKTSKNYYDGNSERHNAAFASLSWKF